MGAGFAADEDTVDAAYYPNDNNNWIYSSYAKYVIEKHLGLVQSGSVWFL
jgi:hypothetical protein